jgi:arabinose-5-phosphate isomerase
MQLAIGDALAVALLEARGFTAQDFRLFHPGGKLGARLSFVRDIMHRDEALPIVRMGTHMDQALLEMTSKRLGCVAVVDAQNKLVGIITDGDLRRHMAQRTDLLTHHVEDVMTKAPLTITPDIMAAEALAILSEKKRTVLIVTDQSHIPVGMVHLHDLYHIGLA